jgi:hypothetical protein
MGMMPFGGPEVLEVVGLVEPETGPGDVRVRLCVGRQPDALNLPRRWVRRAASQAGLTPAWRRSASVRSRPPPSPRPSHCFGAPVASVTPLEASWWRSGSVARDAPSRVVVRSNPFDPTTVVGCPLFAVKPAPDSAGHARPSTPEARRPRPERDPPPESATDP